MTQDQEIQFLPFHALNEFMTDEYRQEVIQSALQALPNGSGPIITSLLKAIKRDVKIPGFRNSTKAPGALLSRKLAEAFEKSPDLVVSVLSVWADGHSELRNEIHNLLVARGWDVLPVDSDRTRLPGFLTVWPAGEDFDSLTKAYNEMYPAANTKQNDISLMVVWISTRLPYKFSENTGNAVSDNELA